MSDKSDKQKVTLYVPPALHRQLKIRAAVDAESMSALAERALLFYLQHPEAIAELEGATGRTHRVYNCPECTSSLVERAGELVALSRQPTVVAEELTDDFSEADLHEELASHSDSPGEEELVPC